MIGLAIGNGTSRRGMDLPEMAKKVDVSIGCNRVYEEFVPDYIVSLDRRMCLKIGPIWKREKKFNWLWRDFDTWHLVLNYTPLIYLERINGGMYNNSGVIAVWFLAKALKCEIIYMPGFDFFRQRDPDPDGVNRNELYTGNYIWSPDMYVVFEKLFDRFPNTRFIRVGQIEKDDKEFYRDNLKRLEHMETF